MKSRDFNENPKRIFSDGLGLQMTHLSIIAQRFRFRASTISAIVNFDRQIRGGSSASHDREEVIQSSHVWFVKVVSTIFVCSSQFSNNSVKYFRENLTDVVALEVIRRFRNANPKLGLEFLEFSRENLNVKHCFWTYNLLMRSLCQMGLHGLVEVAFDHMREDGHLPNSSLLGFLVQSFTQASEFGVAEKVFAKIQGEEVGIGLALCNNLLNALVKQNKIIDAVRLFEDHLVGRCSPDTRTFNLLIKGLCSIGEIDRAFRFFEDMANYQCVPDVVTYNTLINGLCRANELDRACKLLKELWSRDDWSPNVVTYTSIISGFGKLHKMEEASLLFEEMVSSGIKPNSFTFNVLIDGYGKIGDMVTAEAMVENMAFSGCLPDVVTFSSLIDGYCRIGQLNQGLKLWDVMIHRNISPNVYTYAILVNALCKENRLNEARDFLKQLSCSNIVPRPFIYNPVIDGFCKSGNVDAANLIVEEMEKKRCYPDKVTFTILIIGHCMKGRMWEAIGIFNKMLALRCDMDKISVSALISCLLKAGMPDEALRISQLVSEDINLGRSSVRKAKAMPVRSNRDIPVAA